jgi:hypothetical protein
MTILFGALDVLQGALVGLIPLLVPSREPAVNWILGTAAAMMIAAGPMLVFGKGPGRAVAAVVCLLYLALGAGFAAVIAASASYLYGIYGRHGHAVGSIGFVLMGVVLIFFWLIPAHELNFLRKARGSK